MVPLRVLIAEGLIYRQLDYWCNQGCLIVPARGSGRPREWPDTEVAVARTMRRLIDGGFTTEAAAQIECRAVTSRYGITLVPRPGIILEVA